MLAPPDYILEDNKDKSYEELLNVRDRLIRKIQKIEKDGPVYGKYEDGDLLLADLASFPSPDMVYRNNLESLGLLCKLISIKYAEECNAKIET